MPAPTSPSFVTPPEGRRVALLDFGGPGAPSSRCTGTSAVAGSTRRWPPRSRPTTG
ncbi:hypothetical protein NKH77_42750 [Streptomyces sp. M19]